MASAMTTEPRAPALASLPGASLYLVSLALLGPFFSPWFGIWSNALHVGTTTWRFGVYGQLAATQFYLFMALGVAALIAARLSHRKVLFGLGVTAGLIGLALMAAGLSFILDFFQLRRSMNPAMFAPLRIAGFKVVAMVMLGAPLLLLICWNTLSAARQLKTGIRPRPIDHARPVIGRPR